MDRCSSFPEQERLFPKAADTDDTSDCSTILDEQDVCAKCDDVLSDCCSSDGKEAETLLIFDWDDTLFPTTWLMKHGFFEGEKSPDQEQASKLQSLAQRVHMTLENAAEIGKVVIVTNAERGWIEQTCTKFMPSLVNMLKTIDMVSARSTFQHLTQDPSEWKRLAFEYEASRVYGLGDVDEIANLVSIGDSMHELNALRSVAEGMTNCRGKSIKLMERPSIKQLIDQHSTLIATLLEVAEHDGNSDFEIGADALD